VTKYQAKEAHAGLFLLGLMNEFSLRIQLSRDLLAGESLDLIANFDIVVVGDSDTAFHSAADFFRVIFKPLER
jgi:hypothetical protein